MRTYARAGGGAAIMAGSTLPHLNTGEDEIPRIQLKVPDSGLSTIEGIESFLGNGENLATTDSRLSSPIRENDNNERLVH